MCLRGAQFFIVASLKGCKSKNILNPIQTGLFWHSLDWGVPSNAPHHFLKNIEDIDMKRAPLIKGYEVNLLLLSLAVTSNDVAKAPSWIFMAVILHFRILSKRCQ